MNRRERTLVAAAAIAATLAGAAWGGARLIAAANDAATAARDLTECERLAGRIAAARGEGGPEGPEAGPRVEQRSELTRRIEMAALAAGLPEGGVELIEGAPGRLGGGPFVERPTVVRLRGVAMRQLFAFLHALAGDDDRVGLRSIRLAAPDGGGATDLWDVNGTLTSTTYSPESARTGGGAAAIVRGAS